MTPAEELRAAAAKLRETVKPLLGGDLDWVAWYLDNGAILGLGPEDEKWIALMSPALAEPLADLLEFLSGCIEYDAKQGRSKTTREQYALAVARAITGGAP